MSSPNPARSPSRGRVFISYRSENSGCALAVATHRLLSAVGAPPWFDLQALMATAWDNEIDAALSDCAGGILILTPGVEKSEVIRRTEAPRLLERAKPRSNSGRRGIPLAVVTDAFVESGPDHEEIRRRLGSDDARWNSIQTFRADEDGLRAAVSAVASDIVDQTDGTLSVQVHSRTNSPRLGAVDFPISLDTEAGPDLVHPKSYYALMRMLDTDFQLAGHSGHLWAQIERATLTPRFDVSLAAHISVSFTFGFAFPVTRFHDAQFQVRKTGSLESFTLSQHPQFSRESNRAAHVSVRSRRDLDVVDSAAHSSSTQRAPVAGIVVLQYTNGADSSVTDSALSSLDCALHLTPPFDGDETSWFLTPENINARVLAASQEIREFISANRLTELHIVMSAPAVFAFALGRALATASIPPIVLYDYVNEGQEEELAKSAQSTAEIHGSGYIPVCRLTYNSGPIATVYDWEKAPAWIESDVTPEPVIDFEFASVIHDEREAPARSATNIVVLTPHDVIIRPGDDASEDVVLKRNPEWPAIRLPEAHLDDWSIVANDSSVPCATIDYKNSGSLPPETEGTIYVVSRVVAAAHRHRRDLFFPLDEFRDEAGRIVGCRGLGRFPATN